MAMPEKMTIDGNEAAASVASRTQVAVTGGVHTSVDASKR